MGIFSEIKKNLKKYKLHWLKRGITIVPCEYRDEVERCEKVMDKYSYKVRYTPENMAATIRRYAHVLEKGIYMPDRRIRFGKRVADQLQQLLMDWDRIYHDTGDETVDWAKEVFGLYQDEKNKPHQRRTFNRHHEYTEAEKGAIQKIIYNRRSCRNFDPGRKIDLELVRTLVKLANASPSSCNRQTCFVFLVEQTEDMAVIESCSSGGKGFASRAPYTLIVCTDLCSYNLPAERHLIYIDGGIFSQTLMLAAEALGLSTCFLNWASQSDGDETVMRKRFEIPEYFEIIGLINMGYSEFEYNPAPRKTVGETMRMVGK